MGQKVMTTSIPSVRCTHPKSPRRHRRVSMLVLVLAFAVRSASAGQSARLVYSRTDDAASCGDERGLRRAVARRLGYDPFVANRMNACGNVRAEGAGLRAHVYLIRDGNTAGGSRELSSPTRDCTELLAAVALAISIAVDPDALDRAEQPEHTSGTDANSPPVATQSAAASWLSKVPSASTTPARGASAAPTPSADLAVWPKPVPGKQERVPSALFDVGLGVFAATGPAPILNTGAWLSMGARLGNWQLRLQPEFTLPSDSDEVAGATVRVSTYGGNLSAGYWLQRLYLGALFDVVALSGRGQGVNQPNQHTVFHAAAGARVGYQLALGQKFALVPSLDGLVSFRRVEMQLNHTPGYTSPRAFTRLGLSVEYRF